MVCYIYNILIVVFVINCIVSICIQVILIVLVILIVIVIVLLILILCLCCKPVIQLSNWRPIRDMGDKDY